MKHKHADLIHAWADGADIQLYDPFNKVWKDSYPMWRIDEQYRIKPEEKKPVVRWLWAYQNGTMWNVLPNFLCEDQAASNWVKLEWSRTEFPE
jgi:hypothetical protein